MNLKVEGSMHWKVGGAPVNTVKTLQLEKVGLHDPRSSYGGAAPGGSILTPPLS